MKDPEIQFLDDCIEFICELNERTAQLQRQWEDLELDMEPRDDKNKA